MLTLFVENRPVDLGNLPPHSQYIVDVLLNIARAPYQPLPKGQTWSPEKAAFIQPCPPGERGLPVVVPILLDVIEGISHVRIFMPKDIRSENARETVWKSVLEVQRRFPEGIALLDPVQNMGIKDDKFQALLKVGVLGA